MIILILHFNFRLMFIQKLQDKNVYVNMEGWMVSHTADLNKDALEFERLQCKLICKIQTEIN